MLARLRHAAEDTGARVGDAKYGAADAGSGTPSLLDPVRRIRTQELPPHIIAKLKPESLELQDNRSNRIDSFMYANRIRTENVSIIDI